jgi:CRP-like cAMP-binding protein
MVHSNNVLLDSLSVADAKLLRPNLNLIELPQGKVLFNAGGKIADVYFPTNAIVSLVVVLKDGGAVEAAMVGRDGIVGAAAALDSRTSLSRGIVQVPGYGFKCEPTVLKAAAQKSSTLMSIVIRHEQTLYAQAQQSCACMARHEVGPRLCRWLLRARDLHREDELPFTHEFLAEMLGVRRTSVTDVAGMYQKAGLISYSRGKITILSAAGLLKEACECYSAVKTYYSKLTKHVV